MESIALEVFLSNGNVQSRKLHLLGCGKLLLANQDDIGVGLCLHIWSVMQNDLARYTINNDGSDGAAFALQQGIIECGDHGYAYAIAISNSSSSNIVIN
jgi:hypothetical protein